jgi:serine/threonine protein kinase
MTIDAPVLLETLREYRLLDEEQLAQLVLEVRAHGFDAESLAGELCRRGLLTYFQSAQLLEGKGAELVLGGHYVLLDKLGEGGMGAVYKARHRITRGERAVKLIRSEFLTSKEAVQRFFLEAQAAEKLSHPNIIRAYDAGEDRGRCYFVMEYVEGEDLAKIVRQRGPLPIGEACEYVSQAAIGLQHAHERGLVHRDIKPSNLLLARNEGQIKILDLGLARLRESSVPGKDDTNPLTPMGVMMGTPDFMAPEQAEDSRAVDIRADIYALGCTLYQLLNGTVPFHGGTMLEKLHRHHYEKPVPLTRRRPDVPAALSAVVDRMLAKLPEQRYSVPAEVAAALQPFCSSGLPSLAPTTRPRMGPSSEVTPPFPDKTLETGGMYTAIVDEATEQLGQEQATGARAKRPSRRRLVLTVALGAAILVPPLVWWLASLGSGSGGDEGGTEGPEKNGRTVVTRPNRTDGDTDKKPSRDKVLPTDQNRPLPEKSGTAKSAPPSRAMVAKSKPGKPRTDVGTDKAEGWERKPEVIWPLDKESQGLVISADGSRAAARRRSQIDLYTLIEKTRPAPFDPAYVARKQVDLDAVGPLALSPDGKRGLISATGTTDLRVGGREPNKLLSYEVLVEWGAEPRVFFGPPATESGGFEGRTASLPSTRCLAYTGNGKVLLEGTSRRLRIWRIQPGQTVYDSWSEYELDGPAVALAGSPSGRFVAVSSLGDNSIRLFSPNEARKSMPVSIAGHRQSVRCLAFLTDQRLVSGDESGSVFMWDLEDRLKTIERIPAGSEPEAWHTDKVRCVAAASDGERFATGGADGVVCLGRFRHAKPLWKQKCDEEVQALAFSADGRSLLYATKKGIGRIPLRADTGKAKPRLDSTAPPGNGKG